MQLSSLWQSSVKGESVWGRQLDLELEPSLPGCLLMSSCQELLDHLLPFLTSQPPPYPNSSPLGSMCVTVLQSNKTNKTRQKNVLSQFENSYVTPEKKKKHENPAVTLSLRPHDSAVGVDPQCLSFIWGSGGTAHSWLVHKAVCLSTPCPEVSWKTTNLQWMLANSASSFLGGVSSSSRHWAN